MRLISFIIPGTLIHALGLQAQPPIVVDWVHDGVLWDHSFRGVRVHEGLETTKMFVGGAIGSDWISCGTHVAAQTFLATGEPVPSANPMCLEAIGLSQLFCVYQQGKLATVDIGSPIPSVWVSGIHYSGLFEPVSMYSGPGTYSTTSPPRHALIVSNGNFFLGGQSGLLIDLDSIECANRIWKTAVVVDLGVSWTSCLDHHFVTFEMWNDTLLAIGFPTVTKVDTANGFQSGTFDIFNGSSADNGHTAISGDTLYWASRLDDSQIHVGRYLIGTGPVWEVTLPFTSSPIELFTDDYGRLWTAADNNIIWLDQTNGSFQSYAFGQMVSGIDIAGSAFAITGSMTGATSYVLHGHVVP